MKKILFTAVAASIMITQTGCFGSFELTKKIYEWNDSVSDSKFVKTLLFYAMNIIPIYGVASFLDVVIFNLIEFWGGSNPIAMEAGEVEEQFMAFKGQNYKLTATKNQMKFEKVNVDGLEDMGTMVYSESNQSWSFVKGEESTEIAQFTDGEEVIFNTLMGTQSFVLNDLNPMANSVNFSNELASN